MITPGEFGQAIVRAALIGAGVTLFCTLLRYLWRKFLEDEDRLLWEVLAQRRAAAKASAAERVFPAIDETDDSQLVA